MEAEKVKNLNKIIQLIIQNKKMNLVLNLVYLF